MNDEDLLQKQLTAFSRSLNLGRNIQNLFYFLAQFLLATSEMELDYYQQRVSCQTAENLRLRLMRCFLLKYSRRLLSSKNLFIVPTSVTPIFYVSPAPLLFFCFLMLLLHYFASGFCVLYSLLLLIFLSRLLFLPVSLFSLNRYTIFSHSFFVLQCNPFGSLSSSSTLKEIFCCALHFLTQWAHYFLSLVSLSIVLDTVLFFISSFILCCILYLSFLLSVYLHFGFRILRNLEILRKPLKCLELKLNVQLGNLQKTLKCLELKLNAQLAIQNENFDSCVGKLQKKSRLKHFTEKPSLLTFDNLCIIFCPRLSEEAHFHFEIDP